MKGLRNRRKERAGEEGQGMAEYGLILVLIGIFCILMLQVLGSQASNMYSNIANGLGT